MKMANAMFPPSSVEPAVASATEAQHAEWNDSKWRAWTRQEAKTGPQTVSRVANTSECYWLLHQHKHLDGQMCTVTRAGRCLLTQAQNTRGGEALFILWTVWRRQAACVDVCSLAEHIAQHTRTDSPSKAWLPKHSWVAARNHSVSQVATVKVTQSLPRCFAPGGMRLRCCSHWVVCQCRHHLSTTFFIWRLITTGICCSLLSGAPIQKRCE